MAVNPMQRKARQSFLLGMLIMLIIGAIAVVLLFMQIKEYQDKDTATIAASKTVYVLTDDVKSGQPITSDMVKKSSLVTTVSKEDIVTLTDIPDEDSNETLIAKIDLSAGTFLIQSMVSREDEQVVDSLRLQEFNMITLPSDLEKNDYIDIRLLMPNGQDYIVVSKKRVLQASETTIFMLLSEAEIVTMSNAIVESYITEGSMLYALKYANAGTQVASTPTYMVSGEVLNLIDSNANITTDAKNALYSKYITPRRNDINSVLNQNMDDYQEKVEDGLSTQIKKTQSERSKYISNLGLDLDF